MSNQRYDMLMRENQLRYREPVHPAQSDHNDLESLGNGPLPDLFLNKNTDAIIDHLITSTGTDFALQQQEFIRNVRTASIVELIDQLDILQSVAVQAIGFGDFAQIARNRVEQLLQSVKTVRQEALLSIIIDACSHRLKEEEIAPSVGVVRFENEAARHSRVPARRLLHEKQLAQSITLHPEISPRSAIRQLAIDVIGVFDRADTLVAVGRIPRHADATVVQAEPFPISQQSITNAKHAVDNMRPGSPQSVENALRAVEACVPEIATILQGRLPEDMVNLSASWVDVFVDFARVTQIRNDINAYESELRERNAQQNRADEESGVLQLERLRNIRAREAFVRESVFQKTQELYAAQPGLEARKIHALETITDAADSLAAVLQVVAKDIETQRSAATTPIECIDIAEAVSDPAWSPFISDHTLTSAEQSQLLHYIYREDIRKAVEDYYDIELSAISFRSQMQLLQFLTHADEYTVARFKQAQSRDGVDTVSFLESFFALTHDPEMGTQIIDFIKRTPDIAVVNAVLQVYAEITAAVDMVTELIAQIAADHADQVDRRLVTQQLATRANAVLRSHMQETESTVADLTVVQKDILLFAAVCQAAVKDTRTTLTVEDLVGVELRSILAIEVSEEMRHQMVEIAMKNYQTEPHVATALQAILTTPETAQKNQIYVLQRFDTRSQKEQLLAFVRAESMSDGSIDLRSLNSNPDAHGAGIATYFFQQVVDRYREIVTLHGAMVPETIAGTHYIEQNGFSATAFNGDAEATQTHHGIYTLTIEKEPVPSYLRGLSVTALQERVTHSPFEKIGDKAIVVELRFPEEIESVAAISTRLLTDEGYRMTRYVCIDEACSVRLLGFEKY